MIATRLILVFALTCGLTACDVPQPGDPDYERYLRSKADRAKHLYEGF